MGLWQIEGYLEATQGVLHINSINTNLLAEQYGTPLFVFSEHKIRQNARDVQAAFQSFGQQSQVFYASKANSNLAVLQVIRDAGLNIEVNSGGEMFKALRAGFRPDQIIFNGVAKTERELQDAIQNQIFCINVDSHAELHRIIEIAQALNQKVPIALRIVPEVETDSYGGIQTGTHETKFGISEHLLAHVYKEALQHSEHLSLIGLHMHIGAQITDPLTYRQGFRTIVRKAAELFEATGHRILHLNIGGGLPVTYLRLEDFGYPETSDTVKNDPTTTNAKKMFRAGGTPLDVAAATVGQIQDEGFIGEIASISTKFSEMLPDLTIILEPGSRIVADTAVLLTRVQTVKYREPTNETWLLVDAGFNTLLDTLAYHWYFPLISAGQAGESHCVPYKIGGPLCDSGDVYDDSEGMGRLPDYRLLPDKIEAGDLLAFLDTGGYTLEQMLEYNGQPRAAAVIIREDGGVQLIRRRETYEDLIRYDVSLPDY